MTRIGVGHGGQSIVGTVILVASLTGCRAAGEAPVVDREALAAEARSVLDDFHDAASAADGSRYFSRFAADGVFLGTDATERWTVVQFRAYAQPHFDAGKGWTYRVTDRHLDVDAAGAYAWFDEALENARLGPCRGSGVLRREDGDWRIVQYNLSIPIPNDLAAEVADRIKEQATPPASPRPR